MSDEQSEEKAYDPNLVKKAPTCDLGTNKDIFINGNRIGGVQNVVVGWTSERPTAVQLTLLVRPDGIQVFDNRIELYTVGSEKPK